jgi:hypothetical protein
LLPVVIQTTESAGHRKTLVHEAFPFNPTRRFELLNYEFARVIVTTAPGYPRVGVNLVIVGFGLRRVLSFDLVEIVSG